MIHVAVTIPNDDLIRMDSNETYAEQWVRNSFVPFYSNTLIRFVLVGNGVLDSNLDGDRIALYDSLLSAMRGIKNSLNAHGIRNVKVTTRLAMDVLQTTFPPSNGTFRSYISGTMMPRMLKFLNRTKSVLFLDVYPYFVWSANPKNISIDVALLRGNLTQTDPGSGLAYANLLDQMLDSVTFSIEKIGFPNTRLAISGTGWPSGGRHRSNRCKYLQCSHLQSKPNPKNNIEPATGDPKSPSVIVPTFISSLYEENHKIGPGTEALGIATCERNIGLRNRPHWEPTDNQTCAALAPGGECYEPVSVVWHASYAFGSYWAKYRSQWAICSFNGLARETTVDPSRGRCNFPSVIL
ncbi:AMP-dependent synthetase and ligase family protein isoform 1 [Hibiscus syriacus]|uniref:glucan endo-1,3-beta-D-glucosidase n=1 Tax=Hibiscus syriacus TaxID=106335 RepID=A0A6A3BND6_HIBSY|nr:AMP-dependent synthetase and ligase family protein isoform 1 [Hibiscus syriacus]